MRWTAVMVSVKSYAHEAHADTQVSGEDNVPFLAFPQHHILCWSPLQIGRELHDSKKYRRRQAGMKGFVNITLVCGHQKLVSPVPQQEVVAPASQALTCDNDRDSPGSL